MSEELKRCLKELRLPLAANCYKEEADKSRRNNLSYEQYLFCLMELEREGRIQNRIGRLLRESKLPLEKSLQSFDRKRLPPKVDAQLSILLEGKFTDRAENVLAFGNPGSGKSHMLCALGQEIIYKNKRVRFWPCSLLVQHLIKAKRELKLALALKRLSKYDALIIDDIGYIQQSREEMEVLFTMFSDRYERKSILLTSNLPFSEWEKIFKDPMTTAAAIDRLVHHSIILELNIPSYRLEQAKSNNEKQ
jgi:DNA replication protein DnaC